MLTLFSCKKEDLNLQEIAVPNGDFELWDAQPILSYWQTNSCPLCLPPWDPYIVVQETEASNGQFAAKFIFNGFFQSYATNKFGVEIHPNLFTAYVKSNIANNDTASIQIDLLSGNTIVDSGIYYESSTHASYRKIEIPLSQNSTSIDSILISIYGGKMLETVLYVDNLRLIKNAD